ncbi:MAG: hypothetical protein AABZ12_12810 [Planctomycetota bacterium]
MARVFLGLVSANAILIIGAALLGTFRDKLGVDRHVVLAVLALMLSCLTQGLVFTYFSVSGKIVSQAVHLGNLSNDSLDRSVRLKRSFTHAMAIPFAAIVAVAASGGAVWRTGRHADVHWVIASIASLAHLPIWVRQFRLIAAHASLVAGVLGAYASRPQVP